MSPSRQGWDPMGKNVTQQAKYDPVGKSVTQQATRPGGQKCGLAGKQANACITHLVEPKTEHSRCVTAAADAATAVASSGP
eukprot:256509-Chlamydomonas_euryale.AAC.1